MIFKFIIYNLFYFILIGTCVLLGGLFSLSVLLIVFKAEADPEQSLIIIKYVTLPIFSLQLLMYLNLNKTYKIYWVGEFEKIFYCLSFFMSANLFLHIFLRKTFYKKENIIINNKNHIVKTNIFKDKFFFYKNKIHREDYKPSVVSNNFEYYREYVYIHGEKIKNSQLTSKELKLYQTKDKILSF
jgi:hypothetical protein